MKRTILAIGIILFFSFSAAAQVQPQPAPQPAPQAAPQSAAPAQPQKPAPPAAAGQKGNPKDDTRGYIRVHTEVVIIPVTVKDRDGHLIGDLQQDDFRIFQDGQEQQILKFSSDPFPLSAVVLIDDDLTRVQAKQVQKSLIAIAAGFGPSDEVAIVTYDEFPHTVSDFSFNNDLIYTQLKRIELNSHFSINNDAGPLAAGPTINGQSQETGVPTIGARKQSMDKDLDDAIYAAGEMLKGRGRDRRKIIFLISDGNNSRTNQHSFKDTIQLLLTSDISVYSISVGHAFLQHETSRLERYANYTGGDAVYAGRAEDLERLYSKIAEQARNQYLLAFSPQEADKTRDYHTLEVRVRRPNLDILTREGYYTSAVNSPH